MTPIVPNMVGPSSVFFSHFKNEVIVADSKKMTIDSYDGEDFTPGNNIDLSESDSIFSVIAGEKGYYYTDMGKKEVYSVDQSGTEKNKILDNLNRPTQIFIEDGSHVAGEGICTSSSKYIYISGRTRC